MWSAETGGIAITPRPGPDDSTPKPGFPMRPFFGIEPVLMDEHVSSSMATPFTLSLSLCLCDSDSLCI